VHSPKNYLIALLALTTVGGAYLAWRQHGELEQLRTAAMNKGERATLQKRVWDLERNNKQLNDRLAASSRPGHSADPVAGGPPTDARAEGRPGRGTANSLQQLEAMRDLIAKPEFQALMSVQQKARVDALYAPLFKNLNLTPEQTEKLKTILADRQTTLQDVASAAREQGIDPRRDPEGFKKLMESTQADINASIKSVLGVSGYSQFENYEKTLPQRNVVSQLQQRLSYTDTPLTSSQAEQLVQILAANTPARPAATSGNASQIQPPTPPLGGPDGGMMTFTRGQDAGALGAVIGNFLSGAPGAGALTLSPDGRGAAVSGIAPVTPAAVTQSQSVLSAPQVAALQQIQQQQQSQQQINKLISESMSAQRGGPGGPPPPPPSATPRPGGG
jgi:hypothetical protein